ASDPASRSPRTPSRGLKAARRRHATLSGSTIVNADYACVDDDDPAPTCRGTVPNGSPIDTSTVGEKVFRVESMDVFGNTSDPVTVTYRVGYDIRLRFPVASPPRVNIAVAGWPSIVRFQLTDSNGAHTSSLAAVQDVTYKRTSCSAFSVDPDGATKAVPSVATGLVYSRLTRFVYVWRTPTQRGCYTLFLEFDSGQVAHAFYRLI
ncbi:MAG: PxKF domain-containing protein, partial [Actinomycetota bacterium]